METFLYGIAVLACPVGMGLMMWMMMRGQRRGSGASNRADSDEQIAALRTEIDQLKAEQGAQHGQSRR